MIRYVEHSHSCDLEADDQQIPLMKNTTHARPVPVQNEAREAAAVSSIPVIVGVPVHSPVSDI